MTLHNNGIVIQELVDSEYFPPPGLPHAALDIEKYRAYRGLSRFVSWPLADRDDEASRGLTYDAATGWIDGWYDETRQQYNLAVIPDIEYCVGYLEACDELGLDTRILFCKTDREFPKWAGKTPRGRFLGFDYATSQGFYSTIPEDLILDPVDPRLAKHGAKLNASGLFDDETDLERYIADRQALIDSGARPEKDMDFCKFEIFELPKEFLARPDEEEDGLESLTPEDEES
jgi:hypothetical protein